MKTILLLIALLNFFLANTSYSQNFQWVTGIQASNPYDLERGYGVDADANGNTYVTGRFGNPLTLGNGVPVLTPTTTGTTATDIFIVKYDVNGNCLWAQKAGGSGNDQGLSITYDINGYVYVTGIITGTAKFYNSTSFTTFVSLSSNSGSQDFFVAKYNLSGNLIWAKVAGSTSTDWGIKVSSDPSGNCFVTGEFYSAINFGSGVSVTSYGSSDVFLAKYNPSGSILWAKNGGSGNHDENSGLDVDNSGNAYITGTYHSAATYGSFTLPYVTGNDMYVVKYNSAGTILFARNPGTTGGVRDASVSLDNQGNYIVQSYYSVSKYNNAGTNLWSKTVSGIAGIFGIKTNDNGESVTTGIFSGTAAFGTYNLTSAGDWDAYVVKYSSAGNEQYATKCGGSNRDYSFDIATDISGNAYIVGEYQNTASFGPFNLSSVGGNDVYTAKLGASTTMNILAFIPEQGCAENITVEFRNASNPNTNLIPPQTVSLQINGTAVVSITGIANNTNAYIVLKHRNSLETWSKLVTITSGLTFSFKTNVSQAYCNNENYYSNGTVASIFRGDFNQDGVIDVDDASKLYNDSYNFVMGNVVTDLNCDQSVDVADIAIMENSSSLFYPITVSNPANITPSAYVNRPLDPSNGFPEYCDVTP